MNYLFRFCLYIIFSLSYLIHFANDFLTIYPNDRSVADTSIAPFYHGIASGDPLSDRVIIWTRVSSEELNDTVLWFFASDSSMTHMLKQGIYYTNQARDHTVKIDVTELEPDTYYYYMFYSKDRFSQVGRTKTLPVGDVDNIRIGLFSCSNYSFGYFNGYDILNQQNNVDFVVHLGDYIYEDGYHSDGIDTLHRRVFPEYDAFDKISYELRYSWYRLDPSLRELHRQYPWVVIWDDHEFANDAFRDTALRHNPLTQGTWATRKNAAIAAFKEWIPCREDPLRTNIINYTQKIGTLADIIYTENRIERDNFDNFQQFLNISFGVNNPLTYANPKSSALGKNQLNWICNELKSSEAKWKILANQLAFTPFVFQGPFMLKTRFLSSWDFYPWDRKHILDTIARNNIKNFVVLSADAHVAMTFDIIHDSIPYNPLSGEGALGIEFLTDNMVFGDMFGGMENFMYTNNPQLKYINSRSQGFCVLDIKPDKICCDYWQLDSIQTPNTKNTYLKTFCADKNISHLKNESGPIYPVNSYMPLLSYHVPTQVRITTSESYFGNINILKVFPNPVKKYVVLQFYMHKSSNVKISLIDPAGRIIQTYPPEMKLKGLNEAIITLPELAKGIFILGLESEDTFHPIKIEIQ